MLNSKDLILAGIKPSHIFGKCLQCSTIEEALDLWHSFCAEKANKEKKDRVLIVAGSIWDWLCNHSHFQGMFSREMPGNIASKGEKRRWITSRSVLINGRTDWSPDDKVPRPLTELVFFPKGRRITMW